MNYIDEQYLSILKDILEHGTKKNTRAGETLSTFGQTVRFDLMKGLPLLTTKKVYTKGIIHELIWFLKGDTNIKYLIENNVNIWTDDAYRYYKELVDKHNSIVAEPLGRDFYIMKSVEPVKSKEEFVDAVLQQKQEMFVLNKCHYLMSMIPNSYCMNYTYGDLGAVYGQQWRGYHAKRADSNRFSYGKIDQIEMVIDKLKNNPDDRRILCDAYSTNDIYSDYGVALPPCHMFFQFWTRELTREERIERYNRQNEIQAKYYGGNPLKFGEYTTEEVLDNMDMVVPKRELSCMFYCRSQDFCAGTPFNWASYGMLVYIIANVVNMYPGELIYFGGDVHVYTNHIEGAKEQLTRNGSDVIPQFIIKRKLENIDDLNYDDFAIMDYYPDATIKYQLNVG